MATRFYPDNIAVPTITPTDWTGWEQASEAIVRQMFAGQAKTSQPSVAVGSEETSTSGTFDVLLAQLISPPLKAQTISGTVSAQALYIESNAAANMVTQCAVLLYSGDGATLRGVVLAGNAGSTELDESTATNREIASAQALTEQTAQDGDVLVVELGYRATNTSSDAYTGTITLNGGEVGGNDLPADEAETDNHNCWVEFSQNLLFRQGSTRGFLSGNLSNLILYATAAKDSPLTATIPAANGMFHALTRLQIYRANASANDISDDASLVVTSLNLPGHPMWGVGSNLVKGKTQLDVDICLNPPLRAERPGTETVFACPGVTEIIWTVRAFYILIPSF